MQQNVLLRPDSPGIRAFITNNALRQVYKPGLANMDIPVSINALAIIHAENYDLIIINYSGDSVPFRL